MKKLFPWFAVAFASSVMAQQPSAENSIKIEQYHYGMHLDIATVISTTAPADECNPSPVTLIYRDSQGHIKGLEYLKLSTDCPASNS